MLLNYYENSVIQTRLSKHDMRNSILTGLNDVFERNDHSKGCTFDQMLKKMYKLAGGNPDPRPEYRQSAEFKASVADALTKIHEAYESSRLPYYIDRAYVDARSSCVEGFLDSSNCNVDLTVAAIMHSLWADALGSIYGVHVWDHRINEIM